MRSRNADELNVAISATDIRVELPLSRAPSEQAHEFHGHAHGAAALHLPQSTPPAPALRSAELEHEKWASPVGLSTP